jgi:hypothetical protein
MIGRSSIVSRGRWVALSLVAAGVAAAAPGRAADGPEPEAGYERLFNGKDLTGWVYPNAGGKPMDGRTATPDGRFEVKGGVIVVHAKDAQGRGGVRNLYTARKYPEDFRLKLEFRAAPRADSGVYLRGPQLQVRDYPTVGPYRKVRFHPGGWNELDVVVRGAVATTTVNGRTLTPGDVLELTVKGGRPEARLNGKGVKVADVRCRVGPAALCRCNGEVIEQALAVPADGAIGLQAEVGGFEYRNMRIKTLR